jgi:hypothetical protein
MPSGLRWSEASLARNLLYETPADISREPEPLFPISSFTNERLYTILASCEKVVGRSLSVKKPKGWELN